MKSSKKEEPIYIRQLFNSLEGELKTKITVNTDFEIDTAVFKAQENDEYYKKFLLLNFLPLIVKITFCNVFFIRNSFSGKSNRFAFSSEDDKSEKEDLFFHLIEEFHNIIKDYNWSSPFNSYVKYKLNWKCINYRMKLQKQRERECSLEELVSEFQQEDQENDCIDTSSLFDQENCAWSTIPKSEIEDREIDNILLNFINNKFGNNKMYVEIYKLHFIDGMNVLQVTQHFKLKYHSRITGIVKEIKTELILFIKENNIIDDFVLNPKTKQKTVKKEKRLKYDDSIENSFQDLMPEEVFIDVEE